MHINAMTHTPHVNAYTRQNRVKVAASEGPQVMPTDQVQIGEQAAQATSRSPAQAARALGNDFSGLGYKNFGQLVSSIARGLAPSTEEVPEPNTEPAPAAGDAAPEAAESSTDAPAADQASQSDAWQTPTAPAVVTTDGADISDASDGGAIGTGTEIATEDSEPVSGTDSGISVQAAGDVTGQNIENSSADALLNALDSRQDPSVDAG